MWKAGEQLRQNIVALLAARKERPSDLAFALKKHRSWMTRFLNRQRHELQLSDVDKIAAFFGLPTYQLFAPGISRLTERRQGERRTSRERRIGHPTRMMLATAADVESHRPRRQRVASELHERVVEALEQQPDLLHAVAELLRVKRAPSVPAQHTDPARKRTRPPVQKTAGK